MTDEHVGQGIPSWDHPVSPGRAQGTRPAPLPVALVVGTILLALNEDSQLLTPEINPASIVRAKANYTIP